MAKRLLLPQPLPPANNGDHPSNNKEKKPFGGRNEWTLRKGDPRSLRVSQRGGDSKRLLKQIIKASRYEEQPSRVIYKKVERAEIKIMARAFLGQPDYRRCLLQRINAGEAQHIELLLWHYAYGKPVERQEIKFQDVTKPKLDATKLTDEELRELDRLLEKSAVQPEPGEGEDGHNCPLDYEPSPFDPVEVKAAKGGSGGTGKEPWD